MNFCRGFSTLRLMAFLTVAATFFALGILVVSWLDGESGDQPRASSSPAPGSAAGVTQPDSPSVAVTGQRSGPAPASIQQTPAAQSQAVAAPGVAGTQKESRPPSSMEQRFFGEPATASINLDGQSVQPELNSAGHFHRVNLKPSQTVAVEVAYPNSNADEQVIVQTEDGGIINEEHPVQVLNFEEGKIRFNYQASRELGTFRVSLRKGDDQKVLEFWVDNPEAPPVPEEEVTQ